MSISQGYTWLFSQSKDKAPIRLKNYSDFIWLIFIADQLIVIDYTYFITPKNNY
jgi:hypothetical protein